MDRAIFLLGLVALVRWGYKFLGWILARPKISKWMEKNEEIQGSLIMLLLVLVLLVAWLYRPFGEWLSNAITCHGDDCA